jgi:glutathione S-transferase
VGERFTIADAYCFAVLSWASFHRVELSAYREIRGYLQRISQRPAVRMALEAEGLLRSELRTAG